MYFDSFDSLIAMGGHGFYVWLSYGIFALILVWNLVYLKLRRAEAIKGVKKTWLREGSVSVEQDVQIESEREDDKEGESE